MRVCWFPAVFALLLIPSLNLMADMDVIPTPKFAQRGKGYIRFTKVFLHFPGRTADKAAQNELRKFFGRDLLSENTASSDEVTINARLIGNDGFMDPRIPVTTGDSALASEDGYILLIENGTADILAKTKTGVFYAVTTLLQLIGRDRGGYSLPRVAIADYPAMKLRGISDDISRGQISTMSNFRAIIRFLAMHKMNAYMPYIENEFAFNSYPKFSEGRDPLTAEEVARLDAYGKTYHVQIIPAFETLGHLEDVLQKPEFSKYAEFPGATCLDISSKSAIGFMDSLLTEIAPAFSSPWFNMGADESFDVGLGASRKLVDSLGMAEACVRYYITISHVLKSMGKNVMMYGDALLANPGILSKLPKDITIVDWHYGDDFEYPSAKVFRDSGFSFIVSPAISNFTGPFPDFYKSYANIQYFTREGYRAGALGVIVSSWNDNGGAELRELNYPGYAWGAECAWNPMGSDPAHFEDTFFRQFFKTNSSIPRIAYELLSSANNRITWEDFWRAPFLKVNASDAGMKVESIKAAMPEVMRTITESVRSIAANRQILEIYRLVAKMNEYWADRIIGVQRMRRIGIDPALNEAQKRDRILEVQKHLLDLLSAIRKDYVGIYLRTNRRPMLQLIVERFKEQEAQLKSGTNQMLAGKSDYDQVLQTSFIYYPESRPYTQHGNKVDSATFVRTIDLDRVPSDPMLQLIGDTYCKLYINGRLAGEVEGRSTLTWDVEFKRVGFLHIGKFLRKGKNVFVVQSANYDRNGSAGCNVYSVVGRDTISTDSTWKVARGIIPPDIVTRRRLVNAAAYDNGWTVSAPDFSLRLKSWIER